MSHGEFFNLEWFEKEGDALVGEHELKRLDHTATKALFGVGQHEPMIGGYRVERAQAIAIERAEGCSIDLEKYDYFVELLRDSD